MGRNINAIIKELPKARQEKIEAKSEELVAEMTLHAQSLAEVRKAVKKTQTDVSKKLGIGQVAVAQLEKRTDLLLSTLKRYLGAMGAELDLVVRTANGTRIVLDNFTDEVPVTASARPGKAVAKRPTGRVAAAKAKPASKGAQPSIAVSARKPASARRQSKSAT